MQLYLLNKSYELVGVVDEAESILWRKKYNDAGECEIYAPCDEALLALLKKGYYVYRYDDDMFCKIKTVEIETDVENGDHIIATAADICTILSGRIVRWQIVYSGTVGGFIKKVLTDNVVSPAQEKRKIANFVIDDSNFSRFSEKIEVSTFTDDLLALITAACKTYNIGFRLTYDMTAGKLTFKLYKGENKASAASGEYVEFSPSFANIISTRYRTDDTNYKNVVYVSYKNAEGGTELLSLYRGASEPQGEDREEIFVDGTGTSRDITLEELEQMFGTVSSRETVITEGTKSVTSRTYSAVVDRTPVDVATSVQDVVESGAEPAEEKITVTDYTYLLLIRILGENALAERVKTQEFSGDVDTGVSYVYKVDYNLGDTVKAMNDYGIEAEAQITEVLESEDNEDGYNIEPTFEFKN